MNFVNFMNLGDFLRNQVKWSGAEMNSDWAGLESKLLKIFPGAQVAKEAKLQQNNKELQVLESFSDRRTYSVEQV